MPTPSTILILASIGCILRFFIANSSIAAKLMILPHFKSPLNDLRDLREMLYTYETTGSFFKGPYQVGQSELLLHALYSVYSLFNKEMGALRVILALFEIGKMTI